MKKALFLLAMLALWASPAYAWTYRCQILANSTTLLTIPINSTTGIGNKMVWANQTNDSYVYSTDTGCSQNIYIGGEGFNQSWYFSTNQSGNTPYSSWSANAVGVYHYDENTSTTVYDMSQQKLNATLTSASWVNGLYETAFNTSANVYLTLPNTSANDFNTGSFTILLWLKYGGNGTNNYRVILDKGTEALHRRIAIYKYDNGGAHHIAYRLHGATADIEVAGTPLPDTTNWHLLAIVRNTSEGKLYGYRDLNWDGTPASDTAGAVGSSISSYKVGANNGGTENFVNTLIDETQLYNYSMTLDQLRTVYWQGIGNFSRLGAYEEYVPPVVPLNPVIDNTVICFKTQPVCINLKDRTLIYKGDGYYA